MSGELHESTDPSLDWSQPESSAVNGFPATNFPAMEHHLQPSSVPLTCCWYSPALSQPSSLPSLIVKNRPCSLGVNHLCVIEDDFGGNQASTQWLKSNHRLVSLALGTHSTRIWLHSDVCWLTATAFHPGQWSRTAKPYKCKAGIAFWVVSHYQILSLWIWHDQCFIGCVLF